MMLSKRRNSRLTEEESSRLRVANVIQSIEQVVITGFKENLRHSLEGVNGREINRRKYVKVGEIKMFYIPSKELVTKEYNMSIFERAKIFGGNKDVRASVAMKDGYIYIEYKRVNERYADYYVFNQNNKRVFKDVDYQGEVLTLARNFDISVDKLR